VLPDELADGHQSLMDSGLTPPPWVLWGRRQAKMIKDVKFVELKDGPHGVLRTHAEQVNAQLVSFLA